jgi:6,7-dimethyl-8-ribityllumazine synthase
MSTDSPKYESIDASELAIGIVCASFNPSLTGALLARVHNFLGKANLQNLLIERVPGSNEIPSGIDLLLKNQTFNCMVGLGVVIKGSTSHHHLVAEASGHALQTISLQYHTPVINGIVVTDDIQSAEDRITGHIDRGLEFAEAALQMAQLHKKWTKI